MDRARLDDFRRAVEAEGLVPTLTVGIPYALARRSLSAAAQAHLDPASDGRFRVVVLAAGGSQYARLPLPVVSAD